MGNRKMKGKRGELLDIIPCPMSWGKARAIVYEYADEITNIWDYSHTDINAIVNGQRKRGIYCARALVEEIKERWRKW